MFTWKGSNGCTHVDVKDIRLQINEGFDLSFTSKGMNDGATYYSARVLKKRPNHKDRPLWDKHMTLKELSKSKTEKEAQRKLEKWFKTYGSESF